MYFGSTRDVEKCQPNAIKNVIIEKKEKATLLHMS